jgi:hypothetical protein
MRKNRKKEGSALQQRWTEFLGYSVPYLTRMVGMLITGTLALTFPWRRLRASPKALLWLLCQPSKPFRITLQISAGLCLTAGGCRRNGRAGEE